GLTQALPYRVRGRSRWGERPMNQGICSYSAPAESRSDVGRNGLHDMHIGTNPQLLRYGQQEGIGLCDGLVLSELFYQNVRFGGVAPAEDRPGILLDEADAVLFLRAPSKPGAIPVIHQREDAPADGDARRARMTCLFPCRMK